MFSNVAFDVVLGLVFVYLLYSLLVTILGELLATWMGLRARILRIAIERMLNDGYFEQVAKQKWKGLDMLLRMLFWILNKIKYFFLYEKDLFKDSFAGRFYDTPSIKYLAKLESEKKVFFENTKPSYITAENFSSTLINFLSDKGNGKTKLDQVRFCLQYNSLHIQPNTIKNLTDMLDNSGDDINLFKEKLVKWFNETMDRATGWYKRKVKFILFWIGFLLALSFNIDSIGIARILAKDKEARAELVNMGVGLAKDSARYSDFVHNGDTIHSKAIIDSGYSRVTKDIDQANLVLGLGWNFGSLKKNSSIEVAKENGSSAYNEIKGFERYSDLKKASKSLQDTLAVKVYVYDTLKQFSKIVIDKLALDSVLLTVNPDSIGIKNDTTTLNASLNSAFKSMDVLSAVIKKDSGELLGLTNFTNQADKIIHKAIGNKLVIIDSMNDGVDKNNTPVLIIHGKRNYSMIEKVAYVSTSIFTKKSRLLGFILTAFALSLGAPFWFGVLNQLVSIRGTGVKPEESKTITKDSPIVDPVTGADVESNNITAVETTVADNAELALDNFTAKIKNEPGIVGIGLQKENDTPSAFIMVMVETNDVKDYLIKKYGEVETLDHDQSILNDFSIPVKYEIQNVNNIHTGMVGAEIANITTALGFGTLGCFLKKTGSDKNYILSCWHVMKDNDEWSTPILFENKAIIDNANKSIALVEQGCLADTVDVGIAVCNDKIITINNDLVIKSQHREVRPFDALVNTDVQLFGKVCKLQTAKIFHYKININLRYPGGKMHFMKDVFSITKNMQSPTSGGDSGAVVVDMNGTPLGMIIGGNDTFSYAVKFTNMFNKNMLYSEFSFLI